MGTRVYGKGDEEASVCVWSLHGCSQGRGVSGGPEGPNGIMFILEIVAPVLERPGHAFCLSLGAP